MAQSLRHRRARDASGRFWIEGIRQFVHACDAQFEIDTIIHSRILLQHGLTQKLVRRLVARGVRRVALSPEQFRAISTMQRASGIAAVARQRWTPLKQAVGRQGLGWLVIERRRSAGNLGTILRTAEATGMAGVIFIGSEPDPYDPRVVRASMGGIFRLQLVRTSDDALCRWLVANGVQLVGLDPRAPRLWTDLCIDPGVALVLGEERSGLSNELRQRCDVTVCLPMAGRADSLNVAVAAGVMMYELVRQRHQT